MERHRYRVSRILFHSCERARSAVSPQRENVKRSFVVYLRISSASSASSASSNLMKATKGSSFVEFKDAKSRSDETTFPTLGETRVQITSISETGSERGRERKREKGSNREERRATVAPTSGEERAGRARARAPVVPLSHVVRVTGEPDDAGGESRRRRGCASCPLASPALILPSSSPVPDLFCSPRTSSPPPPVNLPGRSGTGGRISRRASNPRAHASLLTRCTVTATRPTAERKASGREGGRE